MATLLIIEDDVDTNEAVCEYLQEAGHNTISAFDGEYYPPWEPPVSRLRAT